MLGRQFDDTPVLRVQHRTWHHDHALGTRASYAREYALDVGRTERLEELKLYSNGSARNLSLLQNALNRAFAIRIWMKQSGHAGESRNSLLEKSETLRDQLRSKKSVASDISARPRKRNYEFVSDRIGHTGYNDGDRVGRFLDCSGWRGTNHDY